MKFVKEQLYETIAFSASTTQTLRIGSRSYWITGMQVEYALEYSCGTSPAGRQDSLFRGISSLSLQGGGRPYLKVGSPDARALYWATRLRLRGRARVPDFRLAASASNLKLFYTLPIIFGVNPLLPNGSLNWFDPTAAIAPDNDLTLSVGWGVAGSTSTTTIWGVNVGVNTATTLRITLYGIVPESNDEEPKFYPAWQSSQWSPSQTYAGLSGTVDLTPGFWYRRTTLMFLAGASPVDNRVDGLNSNCISEIGVKTADGRLPMNMRTIDFVQASQAGVMIADDNSASAQSGSLGATLTYATAAATDPYNAGVGQIDWSELADTRNPAVADPLYGLNAVNKQTGFARLAATVDSASNVSLVQFHEAYQRY